jgi:hypothetical protein
VLVVPAAVGPISFARVAIAWEGSREAVRAVHDALPLLALSQSVEIVTIIRPSAVESDDDAKLLSAHLSHHGIKIERGVIQIRAEEEPTALRKQIETAHYDGRLLAPDVAGIHLRRNDPIDAAVVEDSCPCFPLVARFNQFART